jgi:hypothetical protein
MPLHPCLIVQQNARLPSGVIHWYPKDAEQVVASDGHDASLSRGHPHAVHTVLHFSQYRSLIIGFFSCAHGWAVCVLRMNISGIATSAAAAVRCLEDFRDSVSTELCFIYCFSFPVVADQAAQKRRRTSRGWTIRLQWYVNVFWYFSHLISLVSFSSAGGTL